MELFQNVVQDCNLLNLGFSGAWFTWERGNFTNNNIHERLDRGFANEASLSCFPKWSICHLAHYF